VAAALRYAQRLESDDLVVAIAADTGRNYLSKFFADEWLAANGLLWNAPHPLTLADLVKARGSRRLVTIDLNATAAEAIELLQATGISQLPVVQDGKPVGSIQEITLARLLHDRSDPTRKHVSEIMARPLPQLDINIQLDEAYRLLLSGNTGVLAMDNGKVVDIITRIDLVQYWNQMRTK
jgi:cystathionine beta-synthase